MFGGLKNVYVYSSSYNLNSITMSENLDQTAGAPQGKQMGIAGFVLALVTFVFSWWIFAISIASIALGGSGWLGYLWLVLALVSVVLSAMGMSKLGKTGGKKGLAIAGLVIGIVSVVWCGICVAGMSAAASMQSELTNRFESELNDIDWDSIGDELDEEMHMELN